MANTNKANQKAFVSKVKGGKLMAPLYSIEFFLLLCFAAAYYKAADIEKASGILWAGMSVVIFLVTWRLFGWGIFGDFVGQAALLGGITAVRVIRDFKNKTP